MTLIFSSVNDEVVFKFILRWGFQVKVKYCFAFVIADCFDNWV
jgi:hypothetical protein